MNKKNIFGTLALAAMTTLAFTSCEFCLLQEVKASVVIAASANVPKMFFLFI